MARTLYRIYVDESGDRGMTGSGSPYFVLAAVMVRDQYDGQLRSVRDQLCVDLGKPQKTVLHWADNIKKHDQRKHVAGVIGALTYCRLSFVIVDKARLLASGGMQDHTKMYNYAVRRLLERISWCIDDKNGEAILTFAHVRRFPYPKFNVYLQYLQNLDTQIRWDAFRGKPRIDQQGRVHLLQMADIVAGCLSAAIKPDNFGNLEPEYLRRLEPRIYRRPPGAITSYGVNIIGDTKAPKSFTDRMPWWPSIFP